MLRRLVVALLAIAACLLFPIAIQAAAASSPAVVSGHYTYDGPTLVDPDAAGLRSAVGSQDPEANVAARLTYDAPVVALVGIHEIGPAEASSGLISDVRENSASSSADARGSSTTPIARSVATNTVDDLAGVVNRAGTPYPKVIDPRTGAAMPAPPSGLSKVPVADRVPWGNTERGAFIKQWHDEGFQAPTGGWADYDIHHIIPREYGGTNAFSNLVPVLRTTHQQQVNTWWRSYS
jgi:hypothetical protein